MRSPVLAGAGKVELGADKRRCQERLQDAAFLWQLARDRPMDGRTQALSIGTTFRKTASDRSHQLAIRISTDDLETDPTAFGQSLSAVVDCMPLRCLVLHASPKYKGRYVATPMASLTLAAKSRFVNGFWMK